MLLTVTEALEIAKCSDRTLRRAARKGELKAQKKGKTWLFWRSDLEKWLASGGYHQNMKRI